MIFFGYRATVGGKLSYYLESVSTDATACCRSCQARGTHDPEKFLEEAGQIYTTIFHKYNKRVRPPDDYPSKVKVNVQAVLIHIRQLDLLKQELESVLALNIVSRTLTFTAITFFPPSLAFLPL